MMISVDLRSIEQNATDAALLQSYLQQLIGQPFLLLRFSYGDELSLHFGQSIPYPSPKMQHRFKGSYILGTRASQWFMRAGSRTVYVRDLEDVPSSKAATPITKAELESSSPFQVGAQIVRARAIPHAVGFGLEIGFSDGASIWINPGGDYEVADWELFTPFERYLRAGPGRSWSYFPSRSSASPSA